jgi:carbon monoxide dehydrogenase subunit G
MLHFEGDKDFPQPPADLWAKLSDARFLVQCVPGIDMVKRSEQALAVWTLRPHLAFMHGTLEVTLRVIAATPDRLVQLDIFSKGIGSSARVEAVLDFAAQNPGTRIHWTADVKELTGLLKAIPHGLIQASAQKVIADVWSEVESKLQS